MTPPCPALRVLMTTDAVGGVWIYSSALARALCQRGLRVHLVTLGPKPREDQLLSVAGIAGLTVETTDLALEWIDPEASDFHRAAEQLATIEARFKPDIVHLNGYREAIATWRAPVIVVAHSCVRSWWRACRGEEPTEPRWLTYIANVEAGLSAAERWVAPTRSFRDEITRLYQPSNTGSVIRNGIEGPLPHAQKQPFILAAGRQWDEAKNLSILAGVAPSIPWPVRTNGPVDLRSDHAANAAPRKVGGSQELPHHELLEMMGRAAIMASPAVYEPFGLTVLEAASAGCALVLSDIDTFRELWDGAALFVEGRDAAAWQVALSRLTYDDSLRTELQHKAAGRAQCYSLDATVEAYLELYREAAERGRTRQMPSDQPLIEVQA
jgi:glycosyltransferase involved in cell wall biosynthesis